MGKIFLMLLTLVQLSVIAQNKDQNWYKMFKGKIGKFPVTMYLHKKDKAYDGYYYYDSQAKPLGLIGHYTDQGYLELLVDLEELDEMFHVTFNGTTATGEWISMPGDNHLAFLAREQPAFQIFNMVSVEETVKLRPQVDVSPEVRYSAATIWPKGNLVSDEFLKNMIRKWMVHVNNNVEIKNLLLQEKQQFINEYLDDNKSVTSEEVKTNPSEFIKELKKEIKVAFQNHKLISLANYVYTSYESAVHGTSRTDFYTFDISANRQLKLDDILLESGKKKLRPLLESNFRSQLKIKPGKSLKEAGLSQNKIEPGNNFFVTDKAIGFAYHMNEIGPVAMGEIIIYIPFSQLLNDLKPDFKFLIQD